MDSQIMFPTINDLKIYKATLGEYELQLFTRHYTASPYSFISLICVIDQFLHCYNKAVLKDKPLFSISSIGLDDDSLDRVVLELLPYFEYTYDVYLQRECSLHTYFRILPARDKHTNELHWNNSCHFNQAKMTAITLRHKEGT